MKEEPIDSDNKPRKPRTILGLYPYEWLILFMLAFIGYLFTQQ